MKRGILLIVALTLFYFVSNAQTVTIQVQESDGGCGNGTDCDANIACFDLIITINQANWSLSSYNVWTQYPAPPVMSYLSDHACLSNDGGDTDDNPNGQYRVAGIDGEYVLQMNTPTVFHNICYSYNDEVEIQDSIIASGGTLPLYGIPFFTTVTLVNNLTGQTAGLTIPQQQFLTLNSSTFTCLVPDITINKELTSNADNDGSNSITVGDVLTYTVTATNVGNVPETNVVVSDPKLTPSSTICPTLDAGETCVLVGTYIVQQSDVDAGQIVNTGTVVSDNAGPYESTVTTPVPNTPDISIEKTLVTDISGGVGPGDVLNYAVYVENTGDVTLHNVVVNDPKLTPASTTCPTLAPGSVCTLSGLYVVKQADLNAGQIINTATGNSDETDEVSDQLITPLSQNPEITIEKSLISDVSGGIEVGNILVYYIEVTNTGNITLHNVTISDTKIYPNFKTCSTVAPGGICTLTGTYIVKQSDVDAGQIVNTATGDSDETGPETDQEITPVAQNPEITTVKTLLTDISGGVAAGDVISYKIEATNSGNVTLHNVTVTDAKLTPGIANCATLAPGQVCTLSGNYTLTQADKDAGEIVNEGIGDSDETDPVPDEITTPLPQNPEIETVKTLLTDITGEVVAGDILTYEIVVTNTGDITLHNVSVSDPILTPDLSACATLAPGSACTLTGTYMVSQDDIDAGQIVNQGVGDSDETDPVPDEITTPLPGSPEIMTSKTLLSDISGGISVGDELSYQIVVTNTGGITLHNVTASDVKLIPNLANCASVAPGESCILTGVYTVTQADKDAGEIINEGIGDSDETDPLPDEITTPVPQNPETTTVKTLLTDVSGGINVGDQLTYQVEVTNSGDITLHNVKVTDVKLTPNFTSCPALAPGEACTLTGVYTVTQADKDAGEIINTGIGDSDETDPDPDEITTPIPRNPQIETVKTLLTDISGGVNAGDVLTYSIEVTNIGDVSLHNVTVNDAMISPNSAICPLLLPAESCTLNGNYTLTQADIQSGQLLNTGIGNSLETPPDEDEIITPLPQVPEMSIVKQLLTDVSGGIAVNDVLTYQIVVTNTGNMILNNVVVSDPKLSPASSSCATLVPGNVCILTGTYTTSQDDIDAGQIVNIGTGDSDETDPVTDQLITPIDNINPDIAIEKSMITDISGGVSAGDVITYKVEVSNTGNITLNNVTVEDPMLTPALSTCSTLAPGNVCSLIGTYTITLADMDAGEINNTATGDSDQAGPVSDQLTTPLEQMPEITTVKTLLTDIAASVFEGDVLTYQVVVTNTGNVTLNNVTVSDPMLSPDFASCATLAPGEACTLTGNYTLTQTDVDAGVIVNTGTGDSDETDPDPDQLTTPLPSVPELTVEKTLLTNIVTGVEVGDILTYQIVATNTGNITLHNVKVSDLLISPDETTCAVLAPQEACTLIGTYTVAQSDLDEGMILNTGIADADETGPESDELITPIPQGPEITTVKTLLTDVSGGISVGDVLTYQVVVTNTGDITLNNVTVSDALLTPDFASCLSVAPGNFCTLIGTYTVTQEDKDAGEIINTGIGDSDQTDPVPDELITPVPQNPETTTVKTLLTDVSNGISVGDVLTYRVEVLNSGDITLHNVTVTDVKLTPNNSNCATLAPGEVCTLTGIYNVSQSDKDAGHIINTGIGNSDETLPDADEITTPVPQNPELSTVKTLLTDISGGVYAGDVLTYSIEVTNTGDITLNNVTVHDPMISPNIAGCITLAPAETCTLVGTYTITQADIQSGQIVNTGVGDSDETGPVPDQLITPLPQVSQLSILKQLLTDVSGGISTGDILTYQVEVTNTGNMVLNNVVVSDPKLTPLSGTCATLVPGAVCTLTGTYTVVQADIDAGEIVNTASGDSDETDPVTDQVIIPVDQYPGIDILKTLLTDISGGVFAGDELIYTVEVSNTGNVTLTNVIVSDTKITPDLANCASVAPGEVCTLTGIYTVTQDDIEAGEISNTGTGTSDQAGPVSDELTTPLEQNPEISTVKTMITDISNGVFVGNILTYTVEVSNSGNQILTNVTVTDTKITPNTTSCAVLNPGEVCTLTGTYAVTQDDLDAGIVVNTGTGDSDQTGPEDDELTTPVFSAPEIVANDDNGTPVNGYVGGVTYANVLVNDLLGVDPVNPAAITLEQISSTNPGVSLNILTGEVSVAPGTPAGNYELVYEICEIANPTNCDQATVFVPVTAPDIVANDDAGNAVNGFEGGISFANVLINDELNGDPVNPDDITISEISSTNPGVSLDLLTGEVIVAPGTPAGNYVLVYEICEILNTDNCDQASVTVPVTAPEIIANDDTGGPVNGFEGGVAVLDVLVNDLLNGDPVDINDISLTEISSENPGITLNPATGEVNVAPGTPAGTYELVYEICEIVNLTNCDQATVTVTVQAPEIIANDDTGTPVNGFEGGVAVPDVLVNDLLNGDPVDINDITLTEISSENPGVTLNPSTGEVNVAPGTPAGTYELVYKICEILNPDNCDQATVTVSVTAPEIIANDDTGTPVNGFEGGVALPDVLVNDLLNGDPVDINDIILTEISSENPGVTLNPSTGEVNVAPGTPAGTYELVYKICEILNPDNCDQATVTVSVTAPEIIANDDTGDPINGFEGGVAVPDVLVNDLLNGEAVDIAEVTLTQISTTNPGVTLNSNTGEVSVAPGTPAGNYELVYEICEILNPDNCDQAMVFVEVLFSTIVANDDLGDAVLGIDGGVSLANVLVNDELNGLPVNIAEVTLTQNSTSISSISLNPLTGEVTVGPGTPEGTYYLTYTICEILNPDNCDDAIVTVPVLAAEIIANDDAGVPVNGFEGGITFVNVLINDLLNGDPVDMADITLTQISTSNPGVTLSPTSGEVTVAPGTPAGNYELVYQICEILNADNCDQATVTVPVTAPEIIANDDTGNSVNGFTGGISFGNVLVNDLLNGDPVNPDDITLNQISSTNPGVSLDPLTGEVIVAPGTPAGNYALVYEICEVVNPDNCDQATVTVPVTAPEIIANDDTGNSVNGFTGGLSFGNVLVNDLLNGDPVNPDDITLNQISSTNPGVSLDPLTGEVIVAPGTPAGNYALVYEICEEVNPDNCDQATVTVPVTAPEIIANDDAGSPLNGVFGGVSFANVLVNDLLNGDPVNPDDITMNQISSTNPGLSLDPLTGQVIVAPGTPAGDYELVYEICEVQNPDNCDQATVTVPVFAEPSGNFCFNDEQAEAGVVNYFCSTEPVAFTLCDILTGEAPFTICWELNGVPDCETIVYVGDTLFIQTLAPGNYTVEITSVSDNLSNVATDLSPYNFEIEIVTGPVANAGTDATVCEGLNHVLSAATASNYSTLSWEGGDGVFVPSNAVLNPMYIPGAGDIGNGFVNLCLSAIPEGPCTTEYTDCMTLTIKPNAQAFAGNDMSVCATDGFVELEGIVTNGNPVWQVSIPTGGFFEDENMAQTTYFFSPDDILLGTIELCLTAIPNNPCFIPDTDCLNLTITQSPAVNAGIDKQVCEGESIVMSDATAIYTSSVEWTTNGDGTFNNTALIQATYFPGAQDIANGGAQLCLKGYPLGGCADFSINCLNLTIFNAPQANLGPDRELDCADYDVENGAWLPLQFNNTITGDYVSIEWTSDGDGTFSNPNAVSPNYYLGLSDIWDGDLEICINIQAAGDCQFNVTQCVTIYVPQQLIYFDEDKWWGISSYLETDLPTVPEVMEPLVLIPGSQHLVNMVDKTGKYYWPEPVPPQATLGDWMPIGYKLKVKNTPACLPIYGDSLADQTFYLDGSFTYLPVLTNVPANIEDLFAGHTQDILLIYHWADNQLWTPIASDFDSIYPGYAYLLVNKFGYSPYTIEYPDFVPDAPHLYPVQVKKSEYINHSPWSDVENTALPHIFLFSDHAMNRLLPGDILGAFNASGECFGMAEYGDKEAIYKLVAMGQTGYSKDERGFSAGDEMTFKIYRQNTGEELEAVLVFDDAFPSSDGRFALNGVSMVKDIVISSTSISDLSGEDYEVSVYPNPASVSLNVVSNQEIEEIQLLNHLGQLVYQSSPGDRSTTVDVSKLLPGIYIVAVKHNNHKISVQRVSIQ